jgi:hypothetical protein
LQRESAQLAESMSHEKDLAVRMALKQSLTLLQRRKERREQTANALRAIELQLESIERSFRYLGSQVEEFGSAEEVKAELDAVATQIPSLDALEAEARQSLGGASARPQAVYAVPVVIDSD